MIDPDDDSPIGKAAGVLTAVVGGAATLASGLLDPSWLMAHNGLWFGTVSVSTKLIGPELLPALPWATLSLLAAIVFVAVSLAKIYKTEHQT